MKKFITKISVLSISLFISMNIFIVEATATNINRYVNQNNSQSSQVVPFADVIGWRYKSENGKLYRRLYNYSQEKWIGEWELC